jgi:uncharacterized protein (TIGR02284 family)
MMEVTMNQNEKQQTMIDELSHLAAQLEEGRDFYETAVQNAQETMLKDMFEKRAQQRGEFAAEIADYLERYDAAEAVDEETPLLTLEESIQRGLMTVKAAMTIERDETDETLLQECQDLEKRLMETYQDVLKTDDLSAKIKAILSHQYEQVQTAYAYIDSTYIRPDQAFVLGLFKDTAVKEKAVSALKEVGFGKDEIGIVSQRDDREEVAESLREDVQQTTLETAGAGALGGGAVGSIIGLTAGAGVALVTGPLVAALGITAIGAGIGATYGGIFGSLIGMGIGEEDVHRYLEGIRRGETLVAVKATPDQTAKAAGILRQYDAQAVMTRYDSFGEEVFDE